MKKLQTLFQNQAVYPLLMTHVVAGFPSLSESKEIVQMMSTIADIIEIQIPFSDPVADGPTMMSANEKSLKSGFCVDMAFKMVKELSQEISCPLLFMTYYNIVFCRGVAHFCREAAEVGISGLIVPDMPIDEESSEHFFSECARNSLDPILVVSPLTPDERIARLADFARGFWYAVSRTGTTGVHTNFETGNLCEKIRKYSDLPIALAFGVSEKKHLRDISQKAEMAVVGSATMNYFLREKPFFENKQDAQNFLKNLRE